MTFMCELFNIRKSTFLRIYYSNDDIDVEVDRDDVNVDEQISPKIAKLSSLSQILFYNINNAKKKTPLHIMNAVEILERCKSKELITSFNRSGLCISYKSMKRHREDLAKYAVYKNQVYLHQVTLVCLILQ